MGVAIIPHNRGTDKSGEELYRRYLCGDNDAFTELVGLYERELSFFIKGMVHDTYETKHLMIEAFAQLAVSGGKFEGKSSLKTYLYAIAKNLAAAHMKKHQRENALFLDEILAEAAGGDESPETFLEHEENRTRLRADMQKLKSEHREILALLYFEDMSYKEAGQVMKKTERQIEGLAYRAKASLKKILESEGFPHV